jgi:hypothetical protein
MLDLSNSSLGKPTLMGIFMPSTSSPASLSLFFTPGTSMSSCWQMLMKTFLSSFKLFDLRENPGKGVTVLPGTFVLLQRFDEY